MTVLGMAKEFKPLGIAVNALWPRTAIYTAATKMIGGGASFANFCRQPEIVADAAYAILTRSARGAKNTGNFYVDEDVLRDEGVTDFEKYAVEPGKCASYESIIIVICTLLVSHFISVLLLTM